MMFKKEKTYIGY